LNSRADEVAQLLIGLRREVEEVEEVELEVEMIEEDELILFVFPSLSSLFPGHEQV
jgi:hypothetical protein